MSFRRFVVGWTLVLLVGWLVVAAIWADSEATCSEETSLICFEPGDIWLITGLFVGAVWLFGLFLAGIGAALVWWHRKLSEAP